MVWQIIFNSLATSSIYALMAVAFYLQYNSAKFFNLSLGSMATIGGYTVLYFARVHRVDMSLSLLLGMLLAGLAGFATNKLVLEKMKTRKSSPSVFLVASLGVMVILQALVALIFTNQFRVLYGDWGNTSFIIGGVLICPIQVVMILVSALALLGFALFYKFTKFGKELRAISDNSEVAEVVGINTKLIVNWIFFVTSAIAGVVGILIGFDTGIEPTMGMSLLMRGSIAAIIGGLENVYGVVLGAVILGLSENMGAWIIGGEWKDAIAFSLLIIFLAFRPRGILKLS